MVDSLEFIQWKKDFEKFNIEYKAFKGNSKKRHEMFDSRLDELWNRNLKISFQTFNDIYPITSGVKG